MLPYESETKYFRGQGSYRFTDEQRAAYRLILDIRITSYVREAYASTKTLPVNGFWGFATVFHGSAVFKKISVDFAQQRLIDAIAKVEQCTALVSTSGNRTQTNLVTVALALGAPVTLGPVIPPTLLTQPETVVKFKGDELTQFQFSCYWLPFEEGLTEDILFNSDDPTDGEDEYYYPPRNTPDNPWAGNPPGDEPDPNSDPLDFGPPDNGSNQGAALAVYEFRDAASGGWTENQIDGLGYPGFMFATNASNGNNEVSYRDANGTDTVLVEGGSPPVQVRNLRFIQGGVVVYTPFVNEFSH